MALSLKIFKTIFAVSLLVNNVLCSFPQENLLSYGHLTWQTRVLERYLEFEPVSLIHCLKECMTRKRCKSINYSQRVSFCELSYVEKEGGTLDESNLHVEFVHSDIRHYDKNLIGKCKIITCDENSKCNMKTGKCEISDCGEALKLPSTTLLAYSHHEINNGVLYGCLPEFTMIDTNGNPTTDGLLKCKSDGKWAEPDFKCISTDGGSTEEPVTTSFDVIYSTVATSVSPTLHNTKTETATDDGGSTKPTTLIIADVKTSTAVSSLSPSSNTVSETTTSCPIDWIANSASDYCFVSIVQQWETAKDICHSMGAYLVKLNDKTEIYWLLQKIKEQDEWFWKFWTGGKYREEEGNFVWDVDNSIIQAELLEIHQSASNKDCVYGERDKQKLYHKQCSSWFYFVCERQKHN